MLKVDELAVSYGERKIIEDFNIDIESGKVVSILGPNGSGKSTVLNAIARFIPKQAGVIHIEKEDVKGMNIKKLAQKMCVLSQVNTSPGDFTVEDLIYYGRMPHKKWHERKNEKDIEIIRWAIEQTSLKGFEQKVVSQLSGGERQRVWMALALAQQPKLLMLDEPTTYLDICHQIELLELVKKLNKELSITIIMVLHDLVQAARYSDSIAVLEQGRIVAYGSPKETLTEDLIRRVYKVNARVIDDESLGGMMICPLNTMI